MISEPVVRPAAQRPHVMRRRLFNLLAGVSLLLCLATTALWARSYYRHYILIVVSQQRGEINITSGTGALCFAAVPREAAYNFPWFMSLDPPHTTFPVLTCDVAFAGFGYANFAFPTASHFVCGRRIRPDRGRLLGKGKDDSGGSAPNVRL